MIHCRESYQAAGRRERMRDSAPANAQDGLGEGFRKSLLLAKVVKRAVDGARYAVDDAGGSAQDKRG